jgi:hypothetical protein
MAADAKTALLSPSTQTHPTPTTLKRYFGSGLKIAITLSFPLLLLLLTGPFGYPFAGNIEHLLLASLFFVSNFISLFYYLAQVRKRIDAAKELLPSTQKQRMHNRTLFIIVFALIGVALGLAITITSTTAITLSGMLNGTFFVLFFGGLFLSLACRLNPENKNPREKYAIFAVSFICVLAGIIIICIPGSLAYLSELGSLSKYTVLGVNVFANILFNFIALASYFGKAADYMHFLRHPVAANASAPFPVSTRLWEHKLSTLGLIAGAIIFVCILSFKFNPFKGDFSVTAGAGIMAWVAIASICSKIGRCIDEAEVTPKPRTIWFSRITQYPTAAYFARRAAAVGLFALLGFTLAVINKVFIPPWQLASPLFIYALFTLSLCVLTHWLMAAFRNSTVDTLPCQVVSKAHEAEKILEQLATTTDPAIKNMLVDAALEYIKQAQKLFSPKWQSAIVTLIPRDLYGPEKCVDINSLHRLCETCLDSEQPAAYLHQHNIKLKKTFKFLAKADINLAYKPSPAATLLFPLLVSLLAWVGCTLGLFYIFTGAFAANTMLWLMPLTLGLSLVAWGTTRYLTNKLPGGPYAAWAAIFGSITIICITLSVTIASSHIIANAKLTILLASLIPAALLSLAIFIGWLRKALYYSRPENNPSAEKILLKKKNINTVQKALNATQILLGISFSVLAFLSPMLFSAWDSLGGFSFFALFGFFALELFKNGLKNTPANTEESSQYRNTATLLIFIVKGVFTLAAMVFILKPSLLPFSIGATALIPVALLVAVIMPLFATHVTPFKSKKSDLHRLDNKETFMRWFNRCADYFNTYLGLKPLMNERGKTQVGLTLGREFAVFTGCLVLPTILAILASAAPISAALPIAGVGIATTLLYRWGTMAWRARQAPMALVEDYLYALEIDSPKHDMLNAPYLSAEGALLVPKSSRDSNANISCSNSPTRLTFFAANAAPPLKPIANRPPHLANASRPPTQRSDFVNAPG